MKIVINCCYGYFRVSDEALKILGDDFDDTFDYSDYSNRMDPNLVALIEEQGSAFVSGYGSNLDVVNIPEDATDWDIIEYDGSENVIYVKNGKIHYL